MPNGVVARELGLVEQTLRNWVKIAEVGGVYYSPIVCAHIRAVCELVQG
jgi:hypothetical protein